MPKLPRVKVVLFGSTGPGTAFGQYGSKTAGTPQTEADFGSLSAYIAGCQALAAWVTGWTLAAVGAAFNPYLEDMNGAFIVFSYFIANIFERGIPDWDNGTTYFKGAYVQDPAGSGQIWYSLTDNNLGNVPPLLASNAQWKWGNPPFPDVPSVGNGLASGLVVKPDVGSPFSKVDVDADLLSVEGFSASALSLVNDSTVVGVNGIDAGVRAASNWYYIWVIYNPTSLTFASLISLSATAPTMPAGYTKKRVVGAVFTDGANNYLPFYQQGNVVAATEQVAVNAGVGAAGIYGALAVPVPSIAKTVSGNMGMGGGANAQRNIAVASDSTGMNVARGGSPTAPSIDGFFAVESYSNIPLKTPQTIYWKPEDANPWYRITVCGYTY